MPQTVTAGFEASQDNPELEGIFLVALQGRINSNIVGTITATGLTLLLDDSTNFPSSGMVVIEDGAATEYAYYSSVSGDYLKFPKSFGRGSLATTAAAHGSGDIVRIAYVFTSGPVAGREANTEFRSDLGKIAGFNQRMTVEEGRSEVGSISFSIQDRDEFVTGILADNDFAFRNKLVRFMWGFRDVQESEYLTIGTLRTSEIKLDQQTMLEYRWMAVDLQRTLKETVTFGRSKLSTAMTASTPSSITVSSTSGYALATYIRIDDEIIQVTRGSGVFTIVARGALGTTAAIHDIDTDVEEVYVVEGNPVTLLLRFMLTINGDGVNHAVYDSLDATKGLGIPAELVDVTEFEDQRISYVPDRNYVFHLTKDTMGKFLEWAEQQILRTIPAVFLVRGDGKLSLRVSAPIAASSGAIEIDEAKIIGNPDWDLGARYVINKITVKYDYDLVADEFLTQTIQLNASSVAKHGPGREMTIESRGIRDDEDADSIVGRIVDYFDHRFAEPSPEARMDIRMENINMEASDGIFLSHEQIPDIRTGVRGVLGLPMEISEVSPDFERGIIKIAARDLNRVGKYGAIAPTNGLETPGSAFPDYTAASAREQRYAYICSTATEQMSNGDPPTLIM